MEAAAVHAGDDATCAIMSSSVQHVLDDLPQCTKQGRCKGQPVTFNGRTNRARLKPYAGLSASPVCMATAAGSADRGFFPPAEQHFPLPQNRRSARLEKALAEMGSDASSATAIAPLEVAGHLRLAQNQANAFPGAVGAAVAGRRSTARLHQPAHLRKAPGNPPDLLVIEGDGMRGQATARNGREARRRRTGQRLARMQSRRRDPLPARKIQP